MSLPTSGIEGKSADYLYEELATRLSREPIIFQLVAQVAEDGGPTNDITVYWPEQRKKVILGEIKIDELVQDDMAQQKRIIFDPISRVDGIEPSDDPILDVRAAAYFVSGRERRAAASRGSGVAESAGRLE